MRALTIRDVGLLGALQPDGGPIDLYNEGTGENDWVVGYSSGNGTQAKESNHLRVFAHAFGISERTYVTDSSVDLTDIDQIEIDWLNDGSGNFIRSYLIASTSKIGQHSSFNARIERTTTFSRTVQQLNVSALNGMFFIRVHTRCGAIDGAINSQVRAYRVTLK